MAVYVRPVSGRSQPTPRDVASSSTLEASRPEDEHAMAHPIEDAVVVVTGASSGIGRATVEALAEGGATVAAVARRRGPLEELAAAHPGDEDGRGRVLAMPADVTDPRRWSASPPRPSAATGKLDAWVNNAAVQQYGRFEEVPLDEWRRVVEVNLFGYAHGARAAIPWFREQGEGVLINVASVLAKVPAPMQSAYVASKYAIRGLTESLRQELRDAPGHRAVHSCCRARSTPRCSSTPPTAPASWSSRPSRRSTPPASPPRS
jgi:NAD(P)-dependent dehydrogenase (short-subunit alcohol dehydrogenase family)